MTNTTPPAPDAHLPPAPVPAATEIREAVERAFDFRGDVTLTCTDGREVVGYVFNRVTEGAAEPYLEYFPRGGGPKGRLSYSQVKAVAFSGPDAAAGRSWEAWVKRSEERKKALAEGRDAGQVEPELMPLDDDAEKGA